MNPLALLRARGARAAFRRDLTEAVAVGDLLRADVQAAVEGDREAQVRVVLDVECYRAMREMVRQGEAVRLPDGTYVSTAKVTNAPRPEAGDSA